MLVTSFMSSNLDFRDTSSGITSDLITLDDSGSIDRAWGRGENRTSNQNDLCTCFLYLQHATHGYLRGYCLYI